MGAYLFSSYMGKGEGEIIVFLSNRKKGLPGGTSASPPQEKEKRGEGIYSAFLF